MPDRPILTAAEVRKASVWVTELGDRLAPSWTFEATIEQIARLDPAAHGDLRALVAERERACARYAPTASILANAQWIDGFLVGITVALNLHAEPSDG